MKKIITTALIMSAFLMACNNAPKADGCNEGEKNAARVFIRPKVC